MNIAKKETPKDKLLFGIPTSMKLIYMVVYDMCKYNTHYTWSYLIHSIMEKSFIFHILIASYFQYHSTF